MVDEGPPIGNESFEDTIWDDSQLSVGDDFEWRPAINQEVLYRGIDLSNNNKNVLNQDLDKYMDSKLQLVAEALATK